MLTVVSKINVLFRGRNPSSMNVQFESEAFPLSLKGETAACPGAPGAGSPAPARCPSRRDRGRVGEARWDGLRVFLPMHVP